jgi:hypothetical protein
MKRNQAFLTLDTLRTVKSLDGKRVDEGAASWVLGDAVVVDNERHSAPPGLEGPGVAVPSAAGVDRLYGQLVGLGGDCYVELLGLGTGARGAEGNGVGRATGHSEPLLDGGLVAEPHGVVALRHREEHVALLLAGTDVLDEPGDLPVRDSVAPHHPGAVELRHVRPLLKVTVRKQAWDTRRGTSFQKSRVHTHGTFSSYAVCSPE